MFGKIKTVHRGYIGSQDTFYIDSLEYLRRVCQQTYFYRYSKVAYAKLYITQTPITAADILNERALPFYDIEHTKTKAKTAANQRYVWTLPQDDLARIISGYIPLQTLLIHRCILGQSG